MDGRGRRCVWVMVQYGLAITSNIDEFVATVQEDYDYTRDELIEAIRKTAGMGRDKMRELVAKGDSLSLFKSIRTFNYRPPFGTFFAIGVSAGGYVFNPNTGRLVDYAAVVEFGSTHPSHFQLAQPYFNPGILYMQAQLPKELRKVLIKVSRRRN